MADRGLSSKLFSYIRFYVSSVNLDSTGPDCLDLGS